MNIEAHVLCWNEADTIHLTVEHYLNFCQSVIVWDNFSDDGSPDIARSLGAKVKTFGKKGVFDDRSNMDLKNSCWKKSHPGNDRRDYVIVVDADEVLMGNSHKYRLRTIKDATIFKTQGWNVFSYRMPEQSWYDVTNGIHEENYSKAVIFDPKAITDINYRAGAHVCSPKGRVQWSEETLYLLHYRNVGGPERLVKRHAAYRERFSDENKQRGWGYHCMWEDQKRIKEWYEKYSRSKPLELFS
jgi:glycosyltransferase involved in cell wall biosynthesis